MDVTYKNNKLQKCAENESYGVRKLGPLRASIYSDRIADLIAVNNLEETRTLPGNYHELVQNRKGQWACDLDQPYRLIFTPHNNPIPTDADGKYIWIEITGVEVLEIEDYH